jgi:hypothetical protein
LSQEGVHSKRGELACGRLTFDAGFEFSIINSQFSMGGKLTDGENIPIVDLCQPMDIEAFPQMIPGALRIAMEEIEERHGEIPRDRDVVLYCS